MNTTATMPVWVNGEFIPSGAPAISAEDPGFLLGLAVFDTLLCEEGRVHFIADHLARLREASAAIGIECPTELELREALDEVAQSLGSRCAAIRVTVTPGAPGRGRSLVLTTREYRAPSPDGVCVLLIPRAKVSGHDLENHKTTSRARNVLALERARAEGAYEALLGTDQGDLSEGTVSNLFTVQDGVLRTPSLKRGCLPGILRGKVLMLAESAGIPVERGRIELEDLRQAQEIFLTSSLARIVPVTEIRELRADLPPGPGLVTRRLQDALRSLERESLGG